MKNFLYCILIIAIFGQPNALSVIIPAYPSIALIINILLIFFFLVNKNLNKEPIIFSTNILIPIVLFTLYSFVSLSFAPDPQFGLRILISTIFKFILFIQITNTCYKLDFMEILLRLVSRIGTLFAAQAILLTLAITIFKIQPLENINTSGGAGLLDYDYQILYYGILGFGKQFVDIYGLNFPRFQSMFAEPGFFANFLELSIFSTIAYDCIQKFNGKNKSNTSLFLIIQFIALFGTFSTAGWIATFFGYLAYLRCTLTTKNQLSKKLSLSILICVCLIVSFNVFTSAFPTVGHDIHKVIWAEKFETDWGSSSSEERSDQFGIAQKFFLEKPITGWGSNQLRIINSGSGANNGLMTIAVELGLIGVSIYTAMIIAITQTIFNNFKASMSKSTPIINLNASVTGCVIALIVHSFFIDSNWSFLYWIGIAALYSIDIFFKERSFSVPSKFGNIKNSRQTGYQ